MESTKSKTNIILVLTIEFHFSFFLCTIEITLNREMLLDCRNYFCKYRLAFYLHWLEFGTAKNWIPHKFVVHFILFILILLWQICQQLLMHFFLSIRSPFKYRIFIVKRSGHLMGQFYGSNFYLICLQSSEWNFFIIAKKIESILTNTCKKYAQGDEKSKEECLHPCSMPKNVDDKLF